MRSPTTEGLPASVQLLANALKQPVHLAAGQIHHVFVVDGFPRTLGGGERVVLRHAALLSSIGYRVSIITFAVDPLCAALDQAPCPVYLLPLTGVFRPHALRAAWQLGRFLRREHVSIVETFFESSNLFGGLVTRALSRARLVWNRRDMGILRDRKNSIVYPWLRWLPHHVIAVSEQVRQHAVDVDRIAPHRITVIYNGLNPTPWRDTAPAGADAAVLCVVCLGNLRHVKGQDLLLEAAAELVASFPSMRVEFAGAELEASYVQTLKARVDQLGLSSSVQFVGTVTDLPAYLHGAAIAVLPSRSEGFSNALIESMAAGLPVIATDVGGNREAMEDGVTGVLVPPGDVRALRSALRRLLGDFSLRLTMGMAGRRRVTALFNEQAILDQLRTLHAELCGFGE